MICPACAKLKLKLGRQEVKGRREQDRWAFDVERKCGGVAKNIAYYCTGYTDENLELQARTDTYQDLPLTGRNVRSFSSEHRLILHGLPAASRPGPVKESRNERVKFVRAP